MYYRKFEGILGFHYRVALVECYSCKVLNLELLSPSPKFDVAQPSVEIKLMMSTLPSNLYLVLPHTASCPL